MKATTRVQRIASLRSKRARAEQRHKRKDITGIDRELQPLMVRQLQYENRRHRAG